MQSPPSLRRVLVIGNSDGIGRALVQRLLAESDPAGRVGNDGAAPAWAVTGLSRRPSPDLPEDAHVVCDVTAPDYAAVLRQLVERRGPFDVVVWCVGIGETFEPASLEHELRVLDTNFRQAVVTLEALLPGMLERGSGHFVGLSSLADRALIPEAPSYSASKAGLSSYLEALALACRPRGVHVTNVRFGFVDTKMGRARWRPFLISAERAAGVVRGAFDTRPIRLSHPKLACLAMQAASALMAVRLWFA